MKGGRDGDDLPSGHVHPKLPRYNDLEAKLKDLHAKVSNILLAYVKAMNVHNVAGAIIVNQI